MLVLVGIKHIVINGPYHEATVNQKVTVNRLAPDSFTSWLYKVSYFPIPFTFPYLEFPYATDERFLENKLRYTNGILANMQGSIYSLLRYQARCRVNVVRDAGNWRVLSIKAE